MLNIDEFIKRLETLLEYYSVSASVFADKLGVQRSSLSHLLSGRNKPSLDFVMKITENFPDVDLYWLLEGNGNFPKKDEAKRHSNPQRKEDAPTALTVDTDSNATPNLFEHHQNVHDNNIVKENITEQKMENIGLAFNDEIERIVIFYKNGSFKNYNP